jgi:hypothetical protein
VYAIANGGDVSSDETASDTSYWIKVALGALLVVLALRRWRNRPAPGDEAEGPKWMAAIDSFTPVKAGALAVALVYMFGGDRAAAQLDGWKAWLSANNAAVMAVLFLVFGAVLIGQGIKGLT